MTTTTYRSSTSWIPWPSIETKPRSPCPSSGVGGGRSKQMPPSTPLAPPRTPTRPVALPPKRRSSSSPLSKTPTTPRPKPPRSPATHSAPPPPPLPDARRNPVSTGAASSTRAGRLLEGLRHLRSVGVARLFLALKRQRRGRLQRISRSSRGRPRQAPELRARPYRGGLSRDPGSRCGSST